MTQVIFGRLVRKSRSCFFDSFFDSTIDTIIRFDCLLVFYRRFARTSKRPTTLTGETLKIPIGSDL